MLRKASSATPRFARAMLLSSVAFWLIGVRLPAHADAPSDRYMIDAAQMTVTDMRTGLVWQQPVSAAYYTYANAAAYCAGIRMGFTLAGFRLPTFKELMTLVDPTRTAPPVDVKAFPNTPTEWFWSASDRNPAGPAAVSFMTGATAFFAATDTLRVRCVR